SNDELLNRRSPADHFGRRQGVQNHTASSGTSQVSAAGGQPARDPVPARNAHPIRLQGLVVVVGGDSFQLSDPPLCRDSRGGSGQRTRTDQTRRPPTGTGHPSPVSADQQQPGHRHCGQFASDQGQNQG